jgi:hypothetical protein
MRNFKIAASAMMGIFICFGLALAKESVLLPDLTVESVAFVPLAKEGGVINSVMINVKNQGKGDAAECLLSLNCSAITCNEGSECEKLSQMINGNIQVPALKSGEEINLQWKPASPVIWTGGKYSLTAQIDKFNAVEESDEANNIKQSTVYTKSLSPRPGVY